MIQMPLTLRKALSSDLWASSDFSLQVISVDDCRNLASSLVLAVSSSVNHTFC